MANIENKDSKKENKKRFVKALYSYVPVNNDELTLRVNDILEVIEETEEGWWKGILDGNVGMFPSNFVIELDGHPEEFNNKLMNELSPTKNSSIVKNLVEQEPMIRHGNSLLQINKENAQRLSSSSGTEGDVSSSSKSSHEISEKKIPTPSKKPVSDTSAPRLPPKPVREQARALFPYEAQNEDELSLKEGDIITVISKEVEDKGWWKGELNNKIGVFPDNFVKLIKTDDHKKPERPDKPAAVISSKVKPTATDKSSESSSPKIDKKLIKTPPAKPPPPESHKKDAVRPLPPCPSKKPQPPHPVKKPARISVASKISGFTNSSTVASNVKSPTSETSPPLPTYPPPSSSEKVEDKKSVSGSTVEKSDKETSKAQTDFEAVETNSKKLIHLTASRAKPPNRRPPSVIFLKESEKDASINVTDSRRRSEPLLGEIESIISSSNAEAVSKSAISSLEKKPKVPPPRPFLPAAVKTGNTIKNSTIRNVKSSSSFDETSKTSSEIEKKDLLSNAIPPLISSTLKNEIIPQKKIEPLYSSPMKPVKPDNPSTVAPPVKSEVVLQKTHDSPLNADVKSVKLDNSSAVAPSVKNEIVPPQSHESSFVSVIKPVKTIIESHSSNEESAQNNIYVTRKEFNELLKQVVELTDALEKFKNKSDKAISDLKLELEEERKLRRNIEKELQTFKDNKIK